ncbi:gamma-aminobutyric acid type B receptor subunit 1-like [Amphiura filiformis]|uniref:gamma-aminobutyric acid type B receptor subunit 1-like n=1 Tax=Amphiura filiformis TaxID=82378 RepID=UPI003B223FD7
MFSFGITSALMKKMLHLVLLLLTLVTPNCGYSYQIKPGEEYSGDDDGSGLTSLYIGGIIPYTGKSWAGGKGCLPAAQMALEDVNNRTDILPGYELKMIWNDSACNPGLGTNVFYNLLYNEPIKIIVLTGCSSVSTPVAEAAKMWNLVVMAFGASSPALSNRDRFPTFFRTHPSATLHNPTRIKLCQEWGWKKIAVIQETQEVFTSTIEDLEKAVKAADMEIVIRQSFLSEPDSAVLNLQDQDARIIVGVFYEDMARKVFCEAYKLGLYWPKVIWFLIGWYPDNWYMVEDKDVNCTAEELKEALEGHFTTEGMMLKPDDTPSISGMTSSRFEERMATKIDNPAETSGYPESPLAYDAIWAVALALNKTMNKLAPFGIQLENYTYGNEEIANEIYMALNSSNFPGLSGTVAFSATGDRLAWTQIEQMVDGEYKKIGYYDFANDNLTLEREKIVWSDAYEGKPPPDGVRTEEELQLISKKIYIPVCILAGLSICFAVVCITFNICFQHTGYIQCSQPHINNFIAVGCIIALFCVILLGLDGQYVHEHQFSSVCHSIAWLLSIGFTLGYGSMFSKIWMVHGLVTQEKHDSDDGRKRRRKISLQEVQPWKMYIMIGIFLAVDIIFLTVWQLVDPLYRDIEEQSKKIIPEKDLEIQPQLEHCEAKKFEVWLGILYGMNGLLLIFGLFLAYETRNMTVRDLNDSRYVGMAIYNVAVLCIITAPVTIIIRSQQDAVFGFASLTIVFCCALTLVLIFVPKMLAIYRNPQGTYTKNIAGYANPSKEDEEKNKRLVAENSSIKQEIASKEERIKQLTELISQRRQSFSQHTNIHQRSPSRSRKSRNSLQLPDKLTPPTISCEDSAFVSGGFTSSSLSPYSRGHRSSCAASEEEFSETYI